MPFSINDSECLITVVHCTGSVLVTGGVMRDAFAKGGLTFEHAQIVRADTRWIAILRYHLDWVLDSRMVTSQLQEKLSLIWKTLSK